MVKLFVNSDYGISSAQVSHAAGSMKYKMRSCTRLSSLQYNIEEKSDVCIGVIFLWRQCH